MTKSPEGPSIDVVIHVVFLSKVPKIVLGFARVELQMIKIKFFQFPAITTCPVVVAQDMWWWLRRICGGGSAGYMVGEIKNKANSAQLELELGLSLAIRYQLYSSLLFITI